MLRHDDVGVDRDHGVVAADGIAQFVGDHSAHGGELDVRRVGVADDDAEGLTQCSGDAQGDMIHSLTTVVVHRVAPRHAVLDGLGVMLCVGHRCFLLFRVRYILYVCYDTTLKTTHLWWGGVLRSICKYTDFLRYGRIFFVIFS